jgi:DNA-binding LacI/PurR family transcriptional regulator
MPRVTIQDIAKCAGVSKTSVSFAFNKPDQLSEATLARILEVAKELGYNPDPVASNLKTRQTGCIGILLPQPLPIIARNTHTMAFLEGVGEVCQDEDLSVMLVPPQKGSLRRAIVRAAVDGFLTLGLETFRETMQVLKQRDMPFVMVDSDPIEGISCINIDDQGGAYAAMQHVVSRGHRKIAILGIRSGTFGHYREYAGTLRRRIDGYQKALEEVGLSLSSRNVRLLECECDIDGGYGAFTELWSKNWRPTAIVAMADVLAIGAMDAAREMNVRIPDELAIMGYDNIPASKLVYPPLSTIHQPATEKGRVATQVLIQELRDMHAEPQHVVLGVQLVERESC